MDTARLEVSRLPCVSRATTRLSTNTRFSTSPPPTPMSIKLPPVSKKTTQLTNMRSKSVTSSLADTRSIKRRPKKRKSSKKRKDGSKENVSTPKEHVTDRLSRIDRNNNSVSRKMSRISTQTQNSTSKSLYRTQVAYITFGQQIKIRGPQQAMSRLLTNQSVVPPTTRRPSTKGRSLPPQDRKGSLTKQRKDSMNEGMSMQSNFIQRVNSEEFVTNRYQIDNCLGQGNFAVVSKCIDQSDHSEWALKEIDIAQLHGKDFCIENEVDLMFRFRHDNICFLREAFMTPNTYYLVLEMATDGDLFDTIKRDGPMPESTVAHLISQGAEALRFLHRSKIVHRDIKPENFLLYSNLHVKLTDFGLACKALGKLYRVCGTPTYVAPEILSEIGYGKEVDMWSLGVIMYILVCGYAPFRSGDRDKLFKLIQGGALIMADRHWTHINEDTKTIVRRMLDIESSKRLTAKQLLKSKWLRRLRKEYNGTHPGKSQTESSGPLVENRNENTPNLEKQNEIHDNSDKENKDNSEHESIEEKLDDPDMLT